MPSSSCFFKTKLVPVHATSSIIAMKTFVATDGKVFTDRSLYRKYEMETQYTFRDKKSTTLTKKPGAIQGQPFDIANCSDCQILLLDHCDQVQIDDVTNSKIIIGASSGSIFVRNCKNCTFTIACKQFRARDCENCAFYLYCKTEPVIETSKDMRFGPYNGAYPGHMTDMLHADLDPLINKWHAVFDFNDPSDTQKNWRHLLPEEQDQMWCPLGKEDSCIPSFNSPESKVRLPDKSLVENDSDDEYEDAQSMSVEESGTLHTIKVYGHRAWTIISQTVCSVQAFCLGLIISGMQLPNKMLSS